MKYYDVVAWIGVGISGVATALQTEQVFQFIQLGLSILSTIVVIVFTIWKWWKKAKEDGKITEDEIDDLVDDLGQIVNKKEGDKDD